MAAACDASKDAFGAMHVQSRSATRVRTSKEGTTVTPPTRTRSSLELRLATLAASPVPLSAQCCADVHLASEGTSHFSSASANGIRCDVPERMRLSPLVELDAAPLQNKDKMENMQLDTPSHALHSPVQLKSSSSSHSLRPLSASKLDLSALLC